MAAGDVYYKLHANILNNDCFNMAPLAGTEVVIHNISHEVGSSGNPVRLEFYDGTDFILVDEHDTATELSWTNMRLHCTNDAYYRIKNMTGNSIKVACDGMYTK